MRLERAALIATGAALVVLLGLGTAVLVQYSDKIDVMIATVSPVGHTASYDGPFADNVSYDGIAPDIYLQDREILKMTFDKHVSSPEDFGPWRDMLLGGGRIAAGDFGPADVTVQETADLGSYVRTKNTMPSPDGDIVLFWELVPAGAGPHPAVLLIPGSGNQGARDLVGVPSSVSAYYYQSEMAARLAEAGYAVYVPELRGYGERAVYAEVCDNQNIFDRTDRLTMCHHRIFENHLSVIGIDLDEFKIRDATQTLAHMASLDYVDAGRIGVGGLSLGASLSRAVSLNNPDLVRATVMASGPTSILHAPPVLQAGGAGALVCCDDNETTAAIAPRPLYVSYGLSENGLFRFEAETGHTADFVTRVYSMLGAEDSFVYVVHEGKHEYHVPSVLEFYGMHL